jgi:hypothetical protein
MAAFRVETDDIINDKEESPLNKQQGVNDYDNMLAM